MGELSTSLVSTLLGIIGAAKMLQAMARDNLIPVFDIFSQGTESADEPTFAIIITWLLVQVTLFANINLIANFVTIFFLLTFMVTNLACFALRIGSAPNFRPSFQYFNSYTAAFGVIASFTAMFYVDKVYATTSLAVFLTMFFGIHYICPPKSWGDVSQSLLFFGLRKYLLRLKQEHVKFWRPQILLLVNDPRRSWNIVQFCNALKKGGLYSESQKT